MRVNEKGDGHMKKILSIDGGGIKGVYAASLLYELESKNHIKVSDYFDIIAGTSTGGIIAAALAIGISAKEILKLYMENGEKIFPFGKHPRLFRSKYKREPLEQALKAVFKKRKIADCRTRLLIPAVNIANGKVTVFKTPHAPDLKYDKDLFITDCLLATTAAPIYFEPYKMRGGNYIDGGIGANNPSLIALIEGITRCGWSLDEIKILNIGGAEDPKLKRGQERLGIVDALMIQKCYMMAEGDYAENICRLLLPEGHFYRVKQMSEHAGQVALDKADKKSLELLKAWGYDAAKVNNEYLKLNFFDREKESCQFYNIGENQP